MVGDLQHRSAHHLIDPPQRRACQHHPAGRKHDPGQSCGNDSREHRVKSEVRDKAREITGLQSAGRQNQSHGNKEDKGTFREGQIDRLRHTADVSLVMFRLRTVIFNGLFESAE